MKIRKEEAFIKAVIFLIYSISSVFLIEYIKGVIDIIEYLL